MKRKIIKAALIVIPWILLIWLLLGNEEKSSSLPTPPPDISRDEEIIDSLGQVILEKEGLIDSLKTEVGKVDSIQVVVRDSIKNLPLTESVLLLKTNLWKYEKIYFPEGDSCYDNLTGILYE